MINEKLGPTAWVVAYQRTLGNIKYAQEIFDELSPLIALADQKQRDYFDKSKMSRHTLRLEARYKLINQILEEQKSAQIFEIAAGLSPRGLAMTQDNPNLTYVELDLPEMINEKRKILSQIAAKINLNISNLSLESGDALNYDSLLSATKHFRQDNITVVNEGLLRYLNFEQKAQVSQNVNKLLKNFGGVWITPDITLDKVIQSDTKGAEYQIVKELSGIDLHANTFRDVAHAKEFFTQQGFQIESRCYAEIENELISPTKLGMSKEEVHEAIKDSPVFIMRIASL